MLYEVITYALDKTINSAAEAITIPEAAIFVMMFIRITSYNVCYTKLLRMLYMPYFKYKKTNFTNVFDMMENLDFYFDSNNLERDKKHNLAYDLGFLHQFSNGNLSINTHFTDYNYT